MHPGIRPSRPDEPRTRWSFPGAGKMAARMRAFDWSTSKLGSPEYWSDSLWLAVRVCLTSHVPIVMWWGSERTVLYNDAFAQFLGASGNPDCLGRPGGECWGAIRAIVGPILDSVFRTGLAKSSEDQPLFLARAVPREEVYATFAFGPVLTSDGRDVDGVLCHLTETTEQVIGVRRIETLRRLGLEVAATGGVALACEQSAAAIAGNPSDVPFAAVYRVEEGTRAVLQSVVGFSASEHPFPAAITIDDARGPTEPFPLAEVLRHREPAEATDLTAAGLHLAGRRWPEPSTSALVLPLPGPGGASPIGLAVLGVSPRRLLDADYRTFLRLVAGQLGAALVAAKAQEAASEIAEAWTATRREVATIIREAMERERELRARAERAETRTRDELAVELRAMERLHELSTRLSESTDLNAVLGEVLDATMHLQSADMGLVHLFDPGTQTYALAAQRRFSEDMLVALGAGMRGLACASALDGRQRQLVEDVLGDPDVAPYVWVAERAGFRAMQATPMFSRAGEPLGVVSTYFSRPHRPLDRDLRLTDLYVRQAAEAIERSRASEALRASEVRFRRFFELGLIGMAMTSPTRGCIEVNQELCRMLGYSRDELMHIDWVELTHPDDLATDLDRREEVFAGRLNSYSLEKRWIRKTGEVIHTIVSVSCVRRPDGAIDYLVGLVQDITRRKQVEKDLRRAAADLAEAQRLSHTGSWTWRAVSRELVWSEELYRIFGLPPGEVPPARAGAAQVHPDDLRRVRLSLARALRAVAPFDLQYRIRLGDSSIRHLRLLGRPANPPTARLEYRGVVTDVTETRRAEMAVEEAQTELARVTRVIAMGEVAAMIAHEINQPLGAIVNNASVCLRLFAARPHPDAAREVMQDIMQDAERASDIIRHMKSLTRTASLERTRFPVGDLFRDVQRLAQRHLVESRVAIHTRVADGLPDLVADRVQMQRLLLNLVVNGIEAMNGVDDARRVLTIDAGPARLDESPALSISVTDLGVGFDPREAERLFQPFHTTKRKGMGMGLRIGRSIVEAHGGRLVATSRPDAGATFHCLLPLET